MAWRSNSGERDLIAEALERLTALRDKLSRAMAENRDLRARFNALVARERVPVAPPPDDDPPDKPDNVQE